MPDLHKTLILCEVQARANYGIDPRQLTPEQARELGNVIELAIAYGRLGGASPSVGTTPTIKAGGTRYDVLLGEDLEYVFKGDVHTDGIARSAANVVLEVAKAKK